MSEEASATTDLSTDIKWMWQSNADPWSKTQKPEWSHYSDVENIIIEKAFSTKQTHAIMDGYCIDFKHRVQIADNDKNKQRPVKRLVCNREDTYLRKERFMPDPIAPKRPFGGEYGWISPFILEVRKSLNLESKQLPSNDENIIPMILEKAALGIIEEGKLIGRRREAEEMAEQLMAQKDSGIKEIWKCCAHLYSLESFLYKKLNEAMRLIGSDEQDPVWRSKIRTLGPFCLLLWDNPFKNKLNKNIDLYRGANLTNEQIVTYQDLSTHPDQYRSFQAFTSCSRNRKFAENFPNTNVLFIMEVEYAFTVDLKEISKYPEEEEELITPGVCFSVQRVEFENHKMKHFIHLKLRQRFAEKDKHQIASTTSHQPTNDKSDREAAFLAFLLAGGAARAAAGGGFAGGACFNVDDFDVLLKADDAFFDNDARAAGHDRDLDFFDRDGNYIKGAQ